MRSTSYVPCVEGMPARIAPSGFAAQPADTNMPETGPSTPIPTPTPTPTPAPTPTPGS